MFLGSHNVPRTTSNAIVIGCMSMIAGTMVIFGWVFDVSHLKSVLPGMVAMKFNTALLFILTGLSFCCVALQHHLRWQFGMTAVRKITTVASVCSCLIALITLSQYIFDINTGLDQLFFVEQAGAVLTVHLGRMALPTAFCFVLLNAALLFLSWREDDRGIIPQIAATIAIFVAYQAIVGYTLGTKMLYVWGQPFTAMAIHTAALFFLLSVGLLFIFPFSTATKIWTSNYAASRVIRSFLPIIVLLPLFLAWFNEKIVNLGMVTPLYGAAIGISLNIAFMVAILVIVTKALYINEVKQQNNKEILLATGEIAKIGGWAFDVEAMELVWTEEVYRIHEVDIATYKPSVDTAIDFYDSASQPIIRQAIQLSIEHGEPFDLELGIITAKCNHRWVHAIGKAHQNDGKTQKVKGVFQDITERKKAEFELLQSERNLVRAQAIAHLGSWEYDTETKKTTWSDEAYRIFGFSPREVEITTDLILNMTHPEDRDKIVKVLNYSGDRSVQHDVEYRIIRRDGTERHIHSRRYVPIPKDNSSKTFGMVQDITERKQTEEELRTSEQYARSIINSSQDMIISTDYERRIVEFNNAAQVAFGYNRDEVIGQHVNILYAMPEEGILINQTMFKAGRYSGEVANQRKNSEKFTSYLSAAPLLGSNGEVLGAVGVSRDITEFKRTEKEKQILEERLKNAEKMESLGTLAGGVAHDLNNVLGIIVGYAEMVLDGTDKSNPNRKSLENIMNGGLKAAAIVEDLLTLARRGVQGRAILNINTIVSDCQKSPEFISLSSHHPAVQIKTDLQPDLLNISGSAVHLSKSLYNLISNASEAMPKGGTITIRTTNQYLDKPIQGYDQIHSGDYVVLSVFDTGEGISEHDMKRIFEPFYTKKIMGRSGTGLGLAVVWGTVKDHNGYINVQSEEGKGSTFTLYFPVAREEVTMEAAAIPAEEYMGKGESILVVDDVKEQRELAAGMLRTLHYNVSSISSGEEAVAYLKSNKIDLVVLDMIMDPGMDGLDTYRQVIAISPKQKAIIVSGFSESDRVKDARRLGVGSYLRKPYIKEKLGLAVRKELDRK